MSEHEEILLGGVRQGADRLQISSMPHVRSAEHGPGAPRLGEDGPLVLSPGVLRPLASSGTRACRHSQQTYGM